MSWSNMRARMKFFELTKMGRGLDADEAGSWIQLVGER